MPTSPSDQDPNPTQLSNGAQRRFNRRAVGTMLAGFALMIVAFLAAVYSFSANQDSGERVIHTYEVIGHVADVEVALERAETASRGYLLVPDDGRLQTYVTNRDRIAPGIATLRRLTADNPVQQRNIERLSVQVQREMGIADSIMHLATSGRADHARALFAATVKARRINAIRGLSGAMKAEEARKLAERTDTERTTTLATEIGLAVIFLIIVAMALGTMSLVRRFVREISVARDRLHLLNTDLEGAVAERTADLTRANDEIQRFAYIVSHDLRSPLVNVLGFTAELQSADDILNQFVTRVEEARPDLVEEPVRMAVREDLPEAIGFIRSSTQKMDRLINAILTLSRQGRRVLTPEHLPMGQVMADIVASLATLADRNGASITIEPPLPDLNNDRLAVEQIFSNLVENATKYLRPGRPGEIVIRGRQQGRRVIFEVSDNGRGIAAGDHERIFELFRRSGSQDQAGEGIGLAHVRSLAYRLGGTVTIRSVLGEGSTFVVDLPSNFSLEKDEK